MQKNRLLLAQAQRPLRNSDTYKEIDPNQQGERLEPGNRSISFAFSLGSACFWLRALRETALLGFIVDTAITKTPAACQPPGFIFWKGK
jgi:hypothetical protein